MLRRLQSLWRVLRFQREFEHGMDDELRFHIEEYTADLVRSGVPADEAERRARIEFGGISAVREECREARGLQPFDELRRQVRYALRLLVKTPRFTATALLTLAVCLGANLTIFAVLDAIVFRPLPFRESDRLVTMYNTYPKAGVMRDGSSVPNYYERRAGQIRAFTQVALYRFETAILGESGSTERAQVALVSPEFFQTLGVAPALGRSFTEAETTYQTNKAVILTDAYWRQHFRSDAAVLGRELRVEGIPYTVVGVLPRGFRFLSSTAQLYFPFATGPDERTLRNRHSGGDNRQLIARLAPGATVEEAQAQIDAQNATLESQNPTAKENAEAGFRTLVVPLHADMVAGVRDVLLWLQAGALALLLIGGVNLVNLMLIRASARRKEMAVRQALGAGRWHLASETIVETMMLTLGGGLLGLVLGAAGIRLVTAFGAERLPLGSYIGFDSQVGLAALAGSLLLGLLLAVPIAWFHMHTGAGAVQSEGRWSTAGRAAQSLRHSFVVAQIAITLVLLAGAGLFARSLERAMAISPGFRADHVLTARISVPWSKYRNWTSRLEWNERLFAALRAEPGVSAAGIVNNVPFSGNNGKSAATVVGFTPKPGEGPRGHYSYGVDGDYFQAMGFTLKAGRFLNAGDARRKERVCVVDDDFANYYWPDGNAVGRRLWEGAGAKRDEEAFTVVGVVGAAKQAGLTDGSAQGALYYPYAYRGDGTVFVAMRTGSAPQSLSLALQRIVRTIDPDIPASDVRTMDTRIVDSLLTYRSPAMLAGLFAGIAILLTAIGTYGVLSYAVAQRRREVGLRIALGARAGQIAAQFLRLALKLLSAGIALGLAGALLAGQAMRTLLFQVAPVDAGLFAAAAGIIGVVALAACLLPAHQAARISPMEVLADQ